MFYVSSPDRNLNWRQDLITSTVKVFVSCSDLSFENCEDVVTICLGNDGKFKLSRILLHCIAIVADTF